MGDSKDRDEGRVARTPFILALWSLIAIALLSALAPLGTPLSRSTGSAFNPATLDVVTMARGALPVQAAPVTQPDGGVPPPLPLPFVAIALALFLADRGPSVSLPAGPAPHMPLRQRTRPAFVLARAPPASS